VPNINKGIDAINISNILNRKEVVYVAFRNTVLNIIDEMGNTCVKSNGKKRRPMGLYNTRQSVLRRKRIYASFVKSKIPKNFEVVYR
jgi:hypothetical protein